VSIPLPVAPAARQDRETASKLALVDKNEAELAEAVRSAQAEYQAVTSDATRLQQRIAAFESNVLAPARQRTAAATAAYGSNQTAVSMVFEARQAELEARKKLLNLRRDLAKALAQLNFKPVRAEELQ
jgi:outer membrane protein, heavy metal efflux system